MIVSTVWKLLPISSRRNRETLKMTWRKEIMCRSFWLEVMLKTLWSEFGLKSFRKRRYELKNQHSFWIIKIDVWNCHIKAHRYGEFAKLERVLFSPESSEGQFDKQKVLDEFKDVYLSRTDETDDTILETRACLVHVIKNIILSEFHPFGEGATIEQIESRLFLVKTPREIAWVFVKISDD